MKETKEFWTCDLCKVTEEKAYPDARWFDFEIDAYRKLRNNKQVILYRGLFCPACFEKEGEAGVFPFMLRNGGIGDRK